MTRAPHPRRPTPAQVSSARRELTLKLGPSRVLSEPKDCEAFARDESETELFVPDLVVLADSPSAIQITLEIAQRTEVPVTPRSAGTGKTGGAVPIAHGIVLVTTGMNQIKEIDRGEGIAVVGPGVILQDLHRAAEAEGWFYPPDPNSLDTCCIAGNVAENAAGPRAFKYGATRDWVLGIEAFVIGGEQLQVGHRTRKGVTGYDVTSLLVGSEGTLAVFGDVTLKLIPLPEQTLSMMALFPDVASAAAAVAAITDNGAHPRCMELLDATTLQAMRDAGNPVDVRAGALLMLDVDGEEAGNLACAERIADACATVPFIDLLVAQDASQRDRIWAARRAMSPAIRRLSRFKLSEDIVVPRLKMPDLLLRTEEQAQRHGVRWLAYGHGGDGNLHVNFLWDAPEDSGRVQAAIAQLFRDTVALRGTLSGEHGIGLLKQPFLDLEQSRPLIDLQLRLKAAFDPAGLLNPGKIFPSVGHSTC